MKEAEFRAWMESNGHSPSTQSTQATDAKRLEAHYGDLDEAFDTDRLEGLRSQLRYSKEDERAGRDNPAMFPINGDLYGNLSHYRSTLTYYAKFRTDADAGSDDREQTDKRIALFDAAGTAHWPVRQTNRATGATAFRIMGATNRTQDAIETNDIIEIGKALFKDGRVVRVVRSNNRRRSYFGYGKQKLTSYEVASEIAAALGIPTKGSILGDLPILDVAVLELLKGRFLKACPDFLPDGFTGSSSKALADVIDYKREAIAKTHALLDAQPTLSDEELGGAMLDILTGIDLPGWRTNNRIAALRMQHPDLIERATAKLIHSDDSLEIAVQTMVDEIWPVLSKDQDKSQPYAESRNIPTMLLALVRPNDAIGINTDPVRLVYKQLLHKTPFGWNPLTAAEYADTLRFARALFTALQDWGWQPRDLWDVQSFIWVIQGKDAPEKADNPRSNVEAPKPMANPTNLILYGPPGTGKTYQTAREAVNLCDGMAPVDRSAIKARYDALVEAGQIAFVTFHQSYAYEDFVEGLRPVTGSDDESDEGAVAGFRLEPRRGIFREISALAQQARGNAGRASSYDLTGRRFFKMSLGRAGFEDYIYDAALDGDYICIGWGGEVDWSDPQYSEFQAISDKWNELEPGTNGNSGNIAQVWCFRSSMKEGDIVVISDGNFRFRAIGEIAGPYEYSPAGVRTYNHTRRVKWLLKLVESLPVETIHDGQFAQASCYSLKSSKMKLEALTRLLPGAAVREDAPPDQFVLIIDEINRANISKVFGELITLIEADKRLGQDNALTVKLPYSGEAFGVPSNLHILGTMNTADRSIALLDTALRRRFNFKELMPDPALLSTASERTGADLVGLLQVMNERIEYLFDREHQIGHAYFFHCETIADVHAVMRFRVIPLLAEYFYEDWSKVALVLGDAEGAGRFVKRTRLKAPTGLQSDGFDEDRYRWDVCTAFADAAYDAFA